MKFPIEDHKEGERRTRKRFAWEKTKVIGKDGKCVNIWFEFYTVTEEFAEYRKEIVEGWSVIERRAIT